MNKRRFWQEIIGLGLWPTVTGDPSGDGDGGGGQGSGAGGTGGSQGGTSGQGSGTSGDDDENLGPKGIEALRKERQQREALERQLREVQALSPEVLKQAQQRAEQAERELQLRNQEIEAERQRLESKYGQTVAQEKAAREAAEQRELQTRISFIAKEQFAAAGGSDAMDEDGISAFRLFMQAKGQHFRLDENERLYVVDAQGDPVLNKDGGRVDPKAWIQQLADTSPALAALFKPRQGEGGGMRSSNGTRNGRGVDLHTLSQAQLMDVAWADS